MDMLSSLPVILELPVERSALDSFGYVPATEIFRWAEEARRAYFERAGWLFQGGARLAPVLSRHSFELHRGIGYPDTVQVGVRASRVGTRSLTFQIRVASIAQRATVGDGTAIVFLFDYRHNQVIEIPDELKASVERLESRGGRARFPAPARPAASRLATDTERRLDPPQPAAPLGKDMVSVVQELAARNPNLLQELAARLELSPPRNY